MPTARILTVANHKGGVGKTTSVASIGAALARLGRRVLLIDLDAQQNLTYALSKLEEPESSIYDSLVRDLPLPVINVEPGLDLVPASLELARAEMDMMMRISRESILKSLLAPLRDQYDYIIMDCPPSIGIVTTNALVASDSLYIPMTAEVLPLKGLRMLEDVVAEIQRRINPGLHIAGVFMTRYLGRVLNRDIWTMVSGRYGDLVLQTRISENIALAECPAAGKSIMAYSPKSKGAEQYMSLAREIDRREKEPFFK